MVSGVLLDDEWPLAVKGPVRQRRQAIRLR